MMKLFILYGLISLTVLFTSALEVNEIHEKFSKNNSKNWIKSVCGINFKNEFFTIHQSE